MTSLVVPARSAGELKRWALVACGLCAIAVIFFMEDLGGGFLNVLLLYLPGLDKVLHYFEYCALFGLLYWLTGLVFTSARSRIAVAIAGTLLLGVVDEAQQSLVPDRSVEVADYAANVCGLTLGLSILAMRRYRKAAAIAAAASLAAAAWVYYDSYALTKNWARGQLYEQQQQFEQARLQYHQALDAGLRTASLFNSISWVEIESGHGDAASAVGWSKQALTMRPGDADMMDTYGWALHHAGRSQEALAILEEAFRKKPIMFCINYHLGVVLEALGRPQDAAVRYQEQIRQWATASESRRARAALDAMSRRAAHSASAQ